MTLTLIAAVGLDGAIGRRGRLAFRISDDLRHFKQLTMGCPVIMGRKTFESLPKGALPGRRNIVVTRRPDFRAENTEVVHSIDEAITLCEQADRAFIIGGAEIYSQTIGRADALELTFVDARCPDADSFFPEVDPAQWEMTAEGPSAVDPGSGLTYRFATLRRRT